VIQADVLVIGGGISGCALAYFLARDGQRKVVVLERHGLNSAASGANAGSMHLQMLSHFARLRLPHEMADAERTIALHMAGMEEWTRLARDLPDDFQLHRYGGCMVAENEQEQAQLEQKIAREARHGLEVRLLERRDLVARAPYLGPSVRAAAWCEAEGQLNPLLATRALAHAAQRLGARFCRDTPLLSLRRQGDAYVAQTPCGEMHAPVVVAAAGPWTGEIAAMLGLALPMDRGPMQMSVTEPAPATVGHLVQHVGRRLTLKQAARGNVLIGGGWPARIDNEGRTHLLRESIEGNMAVACRIVPALASLHLLRTWTAVNARIPDGNPILGAPQALPGFFIALPVPNGYTLGPVCAKLVAATILGEPAAMDIAQWSPDRFALPLARAGQPQPLTEELNGQT
jgi:glycine/D-amino acid oxidase-like deaminating enzyme